ncbi:5-formyltetrahydrofolate cyclo-ligase [Microcoleus sp. LEGE 07076]|uniref:5-formyltetrahydrofolate cyclo-ligase n=1 Tax=Microcoleus sp. LEGE 07076 TaxID=915322 RepID=UPI0018826B1E|nr:5-formyltetrahydrofolate cyclo-ligase [Microcoleus sp. LEGE 07076]MBE9186016.1 5-formyltetrahydrofolate cyclo-ligase [Microcoleus sp. LEGE 07076]
MNSIEPSLTKTELRKSLLNTRKSLSAQEWREKSEILCNHLQNSPLFAQAKTILAYFSCRQEPDLSPLFVTPRKWGFPRCVGKELSWHIWQPGDALHTGAYGILEPLPDAPKIDQSEVDLILVPAVSCDVRGYRLGYGGGYYDRMLTLPEWRAKMAIATIFEFALLAQLPVDSWDKPLHGICTESGLKMIQQKSQRSIEQSIFNN